jgi:hypothetical protein
MEMQSTVSSEAGLEQLEQRFHHLAEREENFPPRMTELLDLWLDDTKRRAKLSQWSEIRYPSLDLQLEMERWLQKESNPNNDRSLESMLESRIGLEVRIRIAQILRVIDQNRMEVEMIRPKRTRKNLKTLMKVLDLMITPVDVDDVWLGNRVEDGESEPLEAEAHDVAVRHVIRN